MELGLDGRVAIVTGGSKGIGRETALALALEGVDVTICARGEEALEEAAEEIRNKSGREVLSIKADMTVPKDIAELVSSTVARLGHVDILVNNATASVAGTFEDLPDEAWLHHFNVKVMGYVRCARAVLPHMRARGWGRIINMGGGAARSVGNLTLTNGVTNAATSNFTKNLSDLYAKDGILVNCIHPGGTLTPRLRDIFETRAEIENTSVEELERNAASATPLGRLMEPRDIADLVLFLVSARNDAITGQSIAVDGGQARGMYY